MRHVTTKRAAQLAVLSFVAVLAVIAFASFGATVSPASTQAVTAQYGKKVTICHRSGPKRKSRYHTIRVSRRAVKAHLRHGDGLGPCPRAIFTLCHHKAKSGKHRTIRVRGFKRDKKHLKHGDKYGACKVKKHKKKH
ncbi:MAG TPA: hypothetical protein VNB86_02955 [Gaiellaceae bacterium]|jgi:hypothetical protein|nr:hypothetical protein [Gaiellaceae bacterium]